MFSPIQKFNVLIIKTDFSRYASDHFDTTYVRKQQPQSTGEILKDSLEEEEEENEDWDICIY